MIHNVKVQTVYKLTRLDDKSNLRSVIATGSDLSLIYRVGQKTVPQAGYIFAFDTLKNLIAFGHDIGLTYCGLGSRPKYVGLVGTAEVVEIKGIIYRLLSSPLHIDIVREWEKNGLKGYYPAPPGTLLCNWFRPTSVVSLSQEGS